MTRRVPADARGPQTQRAVETFKTNPVVAEAVCQVAAEVVGDDATITCAGGRANFEITVTSPVVAHALIESIDLLTGRHHRVHRAVRHRDLGPASVKRSLMAATALTPHIGYDEAAAIAAEARRSGRTIRDVVRERGSLPAEIVDRVLDPRAVTGP